MTNLAIAYLRPALALSTLTSELRAKYGNPARTYEYVTGYDRSGITSHNSDANGVAHAVDIFVGPGNLTEAQGITVAEQLRQEGTRGTIPGHPDRLAYIIHRGRIAGDHTGWDWIPYTGPDWHGDHIHVSSVFDYYWGDPVAGNPADYDSTLTWGLGSYTTLGDKPAPITQEEFTVSEATAILTELANIKSVLIDGYAYKGKQHPPIAAAVFQTRDISRNTKIPLIQEVADSKTMLIALTAQVTALSAVIAQLATGQGVTIDYERIDATVKESVKDALADGIDITGEITVGGTK